MKQLVLTVLMAVMIMPATAAKKKQKESEVPAREYWSQLAYRMAAPVLQNMAKGELKKNMQVEVSPTWDGRNKNVTYMECFGRLMAGIAPWLSLPDDNTPESTQRQQLRQWACYGARKGKRW